ncbi:MAG: sugar MFS transporter [Bacteroidia bacterium]|nr:sugar MFS transporter [Bacteroidia bacterium]NNC86705.1 sugar MFS transporter [Bacteroidia bacterium]
MNTDGYKKAFRMLTSLFFMWGFITVSNDTLINTFKSIFDLSPVQRSLVQFSFFGAFGIISAIYFFISSTSHSDPLNKIGYKRGMSISLAICGIGCLLFYPSGLMESYPAFLVSLFVLASGVTCLQICANPYAAILGDPQTSSSRLNLAQGLNSLGTTLGPFIGGLMIYKIFSDGNASIESVSTTYVIYGFVFLALSMLVANSKMPTFVNPEKIESGFAVLKNKHLSLGMLAIFFYVGSEVSVGSWLVEYIKQENIMGLEESAANYFLSWFWGGLMIGRLMASISLNAENSRAAKLFKMAVTSVLVFLFIYFVTSIKKDSGSFTLEWMSFEEIWIYILYLGLNYVAFAFAGSNAARSLVVFCSINAVLLLIAIVGSGEVAFWSLIGTGLFFSIGWSNIFTLAIKDLGKYTSQGSSLLIFMIIGGAFIPLLQSMFIESRGVQFSFVIPLLGLAYLIYYGLQGYKIKA